VVAKAATALTQQRRTRQKSLEVRGKSGGTRDEEYQSVVRNGQAAAHGDAVDLSAKTQFVRTVGPAYSIRPDIVVGERRLQLSGIRPEAKGAKLKPVHVGITGLAIDSGSRRQIDADLSASDRRLIVQSVTNDVDPKAEVIYQRVAEGVSLCDAPKTAVKRYIERKIKVIGTREAAGLNPERIRAEGLEGVGIRPEETLGEMVFASAKIAVPVCRELVVAELARIGKNEWACVERGAARTRSRVKSLGNARSSRDRREQKTTWT